MKVAFVTDRGQRDLPGALRKADGLLGWTLCADALDAVLTPSAQTRFA